MNDEAERAVASALALSAVGLSWLLTWAGGAFDAARTDDWAWARVAMTLNKTGDLHMVGWGPMMLVGLVFWAQPWLAVLGNHVWVLDVSVSFLVVAGVLSAYRVARRALTGAALWPVVIVLAMPGFLRDASTFMTDAPAFAVQMLTLALGIAMAIRTGWTRRLINVAFLFVGVWGFSIREMAIAAPLAVLVAVFVTDRHRRRSSAAQVVGLVAVCGAAYRWRHGLAASQAYQGRASALMFVALIAAASMVIGLMALPVLIAARRRWWAARWPLMRALGAVLGGGLIAVLPAYARSTHKPLRWLIGDYLQAKGMNADKLLLGHRPVLLPRPLWGVIVAMAGVGTVVLAALVIEWAADRIRSRQLVPAHDEVIDETTFARRVLAFHVAISAAALSGAAFLNSALFDRYLWPVIFSVVTLVLGFIPARGERDPVLGRQWASRVVGAALLVLAFALAANSAAFDGARWKAGNELASLGFARGEIDAGFEWTGLYAKVPAEGGDPINPNDAWWTAMNRMERVCATVSNAPAPDGSPSLGVDQWRPLLWFGRASLYLYRSDLAPCQVQPGR